MKPFLGNKSNGGSGNKITLNENDRIVTNASEVADIFNVFYGSMRNTLSTGTMVWTIQAW